MALPDPITITIERSIGTPFGEIMGQVRSWLDSNKIEPAYFKPLTRNGGIGFEIRDTLK